MNKNWIYYLIVLIVLISIGVFLYFLIIDIIILQKTNNYKNEFNQICESVQISYRSLSQDSYDFTLYSQEVANYAWGFADSVDKANCSQVLPLQTPPGFNSPMRITGINPINSEETMYCYIFINPFSRICILSFTGSALLSEWESDFQSQQVPVLGTSDLENQPYVHKGFYDIYLSVQIKIQNILIDNIQFYDNLLITGHSLGGAVSTIAAFEIVYNKTIPTINIFSYTFGSPKVGNPTFTALYNSLVPSTFRINNTSDLIPDLPPSVWKKINIYEHVAKDIPFTVSYNTLKENHVDAYNTNIPSCSQLQINCN
jgi:hypothetical protein